MATAPITKSAARDPIYTNSMVSQVTTITEGSVVEFKSGGNDMDAVLPTSATSTAVAGVCENGGQASTNTAAGDPIDVTFNGKAKVLLNAGKTANKGDHLQTNGDGTVIARTPYSFSAYVLGQSNQTKTAGASNDPIECLMSPRMVEIARPVSAGAVGALTAATVFMVAPGQAKSSSAVPLYVARFTGEVVRNLSCALKTAPGGADTVAYTIQKSSDTGTTWTDTAITCTISAAGKAASDLTHTVSLTAGDMLALKAVSSAGTAADCMCTFDVT